MLSGSQDPSESPDGVLPSPGELLMLRKSLAEATLTKSGLVRTCFRVDFILLLG